MEEYGYLFNCWNCCAGFLISLLIFYAIGDWSVSSGYKNKSKRKRYYYRILLIKKTSEYITIAKKEPFVSKNPDPIYEPGELWFEFGDTQEQALERLKESLSEKQ